MFFPKNIAAALLLLFAMTINLSAQNEDSPKRNSRPRGGIVGAGISFIPTWHFINTGTLNAELAAMGFPALSENGMFMPGVQGYAYIIVIPNLRIGAQWYGGSMETYEQNMHRDVNNLSGDKASSLSSGVGGLLVEYVFPFRRFHIAIGGLVGWGNHTLTLTGGFRRTDSWNDIDNYSSQRKFTNSFFAWQPSLTAEYDLHPFVVLSLTGGYYGTSGNEWVVNDYYPAEDMPEFDLGGAFVRLGLTVGLFLGEW